jgi:adenylate cyclase
VAEFIADAYADPDFNREVDRATGFVTRSVLTLPLHEVDGEVFAVAQLLNREDGRPFDEDDTKHFRQFADSVGVILSGWWRMARMTGSEPETRT